MLYRAKQSIALIPVVLSILLFAGLAFAQTAEPPKLDPATVDTIVAGLRSHIPAAIVASVLTILVIAAYFLQSVKALWQKIPPKGRLLWPIGIMLATSVADALASGKPWLNALIAGLVLNGYTITLILNSPFKDMAEPEPPKTAAQSELERLKALSGMLRPTDPEETQPDVSDSKDPLQ